MPLFIQPLVRYFDFQGRARRAEYWQFWLFSFVASFALTLMGLKLLNGLFSLALMIPSLAVAVRRFHDINRTGWWVMFPGVVFVVSIMLVFATGATSLRESLDVLNRPGAGSSEQDVAALAAIARPLALAFLPGCAAAFLTFIFHVLPGTPGPNRFGDDPKGGGVDIARIFDAPEREITLTEADAEPYKPVFDFSPGGATQQRSEPAPARGIPVMREAAPPPRPAASGFGGQPARPSFGKRGR